MATCTAVAAGLGKFCRQQTNEMPASVHSSCSLPDGIPEKEHGMLGAVTAIPLNLYKHVKDLLAGSHPDSCNGTSQLLLSYSEQSASSGTASPTSDDILLPQLSTSFDKKLVVNGKEALLKKTPAEDVIECQNASFLSKQPRRPTKSKGMIVNKEKKATSTQKTQPSLAKPKLNKAHLNDNTKVRRGSNASHEETATKQKNTISKAPLASPAGKPKPNVPKETSAKSGLWQPRELVRDTSKQEIHRKNQKKSRTKEMPTGSLKPQSDPSMKYPAGLMEKTALPNMPSSQAAPLNIPEMQNTSNKQPLGTATEQSNTPSHKLSYKPQLKPESRKKQTVSPKVKSGLPENSSAQAGPLKVPAPQTTINKQHSHTGASFSEVPNISSHRHIDKPQPKSKAGTEHTVGLKKQTRLPSKPSLQTVQPNVPAPESTSDKQPLKVAARTSKPPRKSHRPTDHPQSKPVPTSKKHSVGIKQKVKLPQKPSQRAPSKAPAPNTSNEQPSGTATSSDQAASNITAHRPRNRMKKISDSSSKKHPVNLQEKTGLRNKPSSQRAPSKASAPRNTRNKQPSKTAAKSDDAPRSIPSDKPRKRPQPKYKLSKKLHTDRQEKRGGLNKPSSQKAPSKAPTPKTNKQQPSKTAAISDHASSNIPSHKPRNMPHHTCKPSSKRHPVDLQEKTDLKNKPSLLKSPRESSPQNTSDEQPPSTAASFDEAPRNIPSPKVTDRPGSDHKAPSISTTVDNSANRKNGMTPRGRLPTVKRSLGEPKEDIKLENISRKKAAEEPIGDKDKQQKDSAKEMNHQAESPRDSKTDVTKPSMIALNVAGHNSKSGSQKMKALDSQDVPSGQWPQMVSARIEGFGPAVIINAQRIQPQMPHKAPHKKKSLLDTVHKIMEACAKMARLLEASSTDEDSIHIEAGGSSQNSVPAKPRLGDNDMNTAFENYVVRNKHHKLPSVDGKEQNEKKLSLKKALMSEDQIDTTGDISRSTGVKNTASLLHNLHKLTRRVTDKGTQTKKNMLTQTKGVSTDCTNLLPQQAGHVPNNKEHKSLQIDLPKNNVTSLIQLLEEKDQQGSDALATPKQCSNAKGRAQNSGVRNEKITKTYNKQPSVVQKDQSLPFQNTAAATPIDCPKTPPPIKLPNGSPHVSSAVTFFEKNAEQQDRNGPTSPKLHSRSRGERDQKPATYHDGNTTQKAEAMNVVQPYVHTRKAANAESSELATQSVTSNSQQSVLHLDVPRNVSSLDQLLEDNAQKWNKAVSHKLPSKPACTALQKTTKDDDTSRSEDVQAPVCQEDQPWPCQRRKMFRCTVSRPKKTHHTTFR
nr:proteoglycan 4-like isoform X2 [Dermacentor andersoni]XP_054924479.1 proteoglycan 4-like isoform X2 [Dermacentor andersoni]